MKIELEYPYKEDWKYGYLVVNPKGRFNLILYNSHNDRRTTPYSRYLMAVSLGRYLTKDEHVNHIDGDFTNNSIENLQILTPKERIRKSLLKTYKLKCPACGRDFERTASELRGRKHKIETNTICCSRRCGRLYSTAKRKHKSLVPGSSPGGTASNKRIGGIMRVYAPDPNEYGFEYARDIFNPNTDTLTVQSQGSYVRKNSDREEEYMAISLYSGASSVEVDRLYQPARWVFMLVTGYDLFGIRKARAFPAVSTEFVTLSDRLVFKKGTMDDIFDEEVLECFKEEYHCPGKGVYCSGTIEDVMVLTKGDVKQYIKDLNAALQKKRQQIKSL